MVVRYLPRCRCGGGGICLANSASEIVESGKFRNSLSGLYLNKDMQSPGSHRMVTDHWSV